MLLAGPFCFAPLADSDTGWHVAVGRLVLGGTLQHSNAPRPHVASWALLAAVLALAPRDTRWRGLCVALVAVGGNLHAGAVFAAFVLALHALEAFWRTRRRAELAIAACAGLFEKPSARIRVQPTSDRPPTGRVGRAARGQPAGSCQSSTIRPSGSRQ